MVVLRSHKTTTTVIDNFDLIHDTQLCTTDEKSFSIRSTPLFYMYLFLIYKLKS